MGSLSSARHGVLCRDTISSFVSRSEILGVLACSVLSMMAGCEWSRSFSKRKWKLMTPTRSRLPAPARLSEKVLDAALDQTYSISRYTEGPSLHHISLPASYNIMLLKRKRSEADLVATSPFSTTSINSSTREPSQSPTLPYSSHFQPSNVTSWPSTPSNAPRAYLHSRTRKRYRDNRPEQEKVHGMLQFSSPYRPAESVVKENTLDKLFTAQRTRPHAAPILSQSAPLTPLPPAQSQQSSLHSFWKLPGTAEISPAQGGLGAQRQECGRCEDCDRVLEMDGDGMDFPMMDVDVVAADHACSGCRRRVCGLCSVDRRGRVCLQCATAG